MDYENERRWVLDRLPSESYLGEGEPVQQGYITVSPFELRLRRTGFPGEGGMWRYLYYMTTKGVGLKSRLHWETEIPEWVFENLWTNTESRRIEKTRYSFFFRSLGRVFYIDKHRDKLAGLVTVEVEFLDDKKEMEEFIFPEGQDLFDGIRVREVTDDILYQSHSLVVYGLPSDFSNLFG